MTVDTEIKIAVIGMGYVGLPLAIQFATAFPTIGFDVSSARIAELADHLDHTKEVSNKTLQASSLSYTTSTDEIAHCNVYIIAVPTPIDEHKQPDLGPLHNATKTVAGILQPGDTVIYESTVYPGATQEQCVPILVKYSKLLYNQDFFVGYSPERINPGDTKHQLTNIVKITAGSNPAAAKFVDDLYKKIIQAGTYPVSSIAVAEAAKVIENTQRDINIALMNELAMIFHKMQLDTDEIIQAAASKWNFLPFKPGLVGGHCIGVDPYYLTYKAQALGYHPEIILSGRRINDGTGFYIAARVIKLMSTNEIHIVNAKILIMGITFKENCPDMRNTKVIDIIKTLREYRAQVDVYDPVAVAKDAKQYYDIELIPRPPEQHYDAIILAVAHQQFAAMPPEQIRNFGKATSVLFDVKSLLPKQFTNDRL